MTSFVTNDAMTRKVKEAEAAVQREKDEQSGLVLPPQPVQDSKVGGQHNHKLIFSYF